MTNNLSFKDKCKVYLAQWLVKWGKLTHDDFTKAELRDLINDSFPYTFTFNIPMGTGTVTVLEGNITLDNANNRIGLQCLAALNIVVASTTIYRAHVVFTVSASPHYDKNMSTLYLTGLSTDSVSLVNDDYALIKDTQFLVSRFFPKSVNSLLGGSLKSALSLFSAGTSDIAADYLQVYLTGSKQAVLEYHIPHINDAIKKQINQEDLSHTMRGDHWREVLFSKLGQNVRVEDEVLRFYLIE
ncbi:DUF1439 domain-containing protein [Alteromonas gracilis]|uniref:DUF1439 domain-containing protein n=1 Tax=Alteromonas gracilis TaxID=1479524 RepID=UPI002FE10652